MERRDSRADDGAIYPLDSIPIDAGHSLTFQLDRDYPGTRENDLGEVRHSREIQCEEKPIPYGHDDPNQES